MRRSIDRETLARAAEMVDYSPETGLFTWKRREAYHFAGTGRGGADAACRTWNKQHAGRIAGTLTSAGYIVLCVFNRQVASHRLAHFIATGQNPEHIDHINGDKSDNRALNLRGAEPRDNNRNRPTPKNNTSGVAGVVAHRGKWQVRVGLKYVGRFGSFDEAVRAREAALTADGYHENHGRRS